MATADIDNVVNELIAEALANVLEQVAALEEDVTTLEAAIAALEASPNLDLVGKTITLTVTAVE